MSVIHYGPVLVGQETTYASCGKRIVSLNNVTARLTKIMNNLLEHLKILIFKVFFSVENWLNLSKKKFCEEN